MLEANYLTMLLKPNYEKPIDSAEDVLERGLTVIYGPYAEGRGYSNFLRKRIGIV